MALTPKQEAFAQAIVTGMSQSDAYRAAFNVRAGTNPKSVNVAASKLMSDPNITQRVAELRGKLVERALWTREMSVKALITAYKEGNSAAKVSAVKELNLMHGYNEPIKHEVTGKDGDALIPAPVYKIVKE